MVQKIQRLATLLIVLGFIGGTLFAEDSEQVRSPQGAPWTLDEALGQLELYPRDAYLQYVALQLARRGGEDDFKRVVESLRGTAGRGGQRNRVRRRAQIDLFSLTTGALAVQESLQLDAMTADVDGRFVDRGGVGAQGQRGQRRRHQMIFHGTPALARQLKHLGIAMHNFHDAKKKFPAAATYDSKGQPLLSWRVHLLPYLGQQELFDQFHPDEPWNSPHNKLLIAKMPKVFQSPENRADKNYKTRFLVPVGETTIFPGRKAIGFALIRDGSSNTVLLVQAASESAVVWTKPDDLQLDPKAPQTGIFGPKPGWFHVTMADGGARSIPTTVKPALLRNLFDRADGEPISWGDVYAKRPSMPTEREPSNIGIGELSGPTVRSHPFEEMLAGRSPVVSKLATAVPEDFYFVRFRSLSKLLEMAENSDLWAAHLFSQSVQNATTSRVFQNLQEQLCIETNDLLRPFYDQIVQEIAVTGSDLFLREGTDVTLLFRFEKEAEKETIFKLQMDGFLANVTKRHPQSTRSTGSYRDVAFDHLTTPDRHVHVFSAYPQKGLHVRSNSRVAFERILDTLQGRDSESSEATVTKPLADAFEFRYMRTLYELGSPEEDGFIYLSDAFIRELVGPVRKITERRRVQCYNHLRMLGHASMLYRTEHGEAPKTLDQLIKTKCLPKKFGTGKFSCPDDGHYLLEDGLKCSCSVHGHVGRMTPCCEIPVKQITLTEQVLYQQFLQEYNQYWRTFFDPIGIRLKASLESYRLETIVLPLIDNSIYTTMAQVLGGAPRQLDNLPVPKRNIFSIGLKFDKDKLIESEAAAARDAELKDMKKIALAFHNYESVKRRFPPSDKKEGGLSWRVHLLPYLEEGQLYERFQLDKPWDSPHNLKLLEEMPKVYGKEGTTTRIVGFSGEGAPFGKQQGLGFREIRDGTSQTILVVEAGPNKAVPWTQPADLPFDPTNPIDALGAIPDDEFKAAFMDGSIQRLPKDIDATRLKGLVTYRGGERVSRNNQPRRRRQPRAMIDTRTISRSLRSFGVSEQEVETLGVPHFLTRGLGDQLSFHIYDAEPTFAFRLSQFVGRTLGTWNRGGFGGNRLLWLPLVSSLNSPIYFAMPVADEQIVDQFLERLDQVLAKAARRQMGRGWFSFDADYYRLLSEGHTVRCFAWEFFSFRFRFFVARVEDALVIATQPFIVDDLFKQAAADTNVDPAPDSVAHLFVRIRPENWDRILADFRLGWAESNRTSCLKNLGPLSGIVRAYGGTGRQALDRARDLHGVGYFCPEGGRYKVVAADNLGHNGRQKVRCSLHGDANAPRQPTAPARDSKLERLLSEFTGMTAALTFTKDGLRAVLRIDRQQVGQKAQQP